jgi:hypothetical protein
VKRLRVKVLSGPDAQAAARSLEDWARSRPELELSGSAPDVLVSVGGAPADPEPAALGVVALCHGDGQLVRGPVPGFWECLREHPRTGFVICALREGRWRALVEGSYRTMFSFARNRGRLWDQGLVHLKDVLLAAAAEGRLPPEGRVLEERAEEAPGALDAGLYAVKLAGRLALRAAGKLGLAERWNVSWMPGTWDRPDFSRRVEAAPPRGRMWADPFAVEHEGRLYCFVEDYVYARRRARISALELTDRGAVELGVAVDEPFHLSFPYLFRYRDELYMCPEASRSGKITIYRCKNFPLEWEPASVALDGVSAADTMIFERGGRWWLLTNLDRAGTSEFNSELYLYSAESPLDGRWTPHPKNPLRIDPICGRNAGLIADGGRLLRAAQRQGFDRYGEAVRFYEITKLTETEYAEELRGEIPPSFKKGLLGAHHASSALGRLVVDHCAYALFP